ncbi:MAG TPA: serine O-acetyltransferase [Gammaproteobacteria bacterium]|nr:serine O-acetyltransferase [Gammaproteobacteria bacterium]
MFDRIREDIRIVYERDPAARNAFEIMTAYPGMQAIWAHRFNHRLHGWGLKWLSRWLAGLVRWFTGVEIHPGAKIGRRFFIDHGMGIVIGETAEIGDDCTLYHGVTLGGTHWKKGKRHPTLGTNVVVGAGAKILGPVMIGDMARIGSNSVVLMDVAEAATVVGVPGHVVQASKAEVKKTHAEIAKKLGFDAYGMHDEMPDPVANAVNCMLDHIHTIDQRLEQMCGAIKGLGAEIADLNIPELDSCEITSVAETLEKQHSKEADEQAADTDQGADK